MLPAGSAADRHARRNVGIFGYALFALAVLGLAVASWYEDHIELVFALLMAIGAARAIASPSIEALLPQLVQPRRLASAQAWQVSLGERASIGRPPIGGLLIAAFGAPAWAYVISESSRAAWWQLY
jgi:MFS family permease